MYSEEIVAPMRADLTTAGFAELKTPGDVETLLNNEKGSVLLVVNSVCGCSAGGARPAVKMALENEKRPGKLATVFAGVDTAATAKAREHMLPYPSSSPSIALFNKGKLVHFIERHQIESSSAQMIAENLKAAFDKHCN